MMPSEIKVRRTEDTVKLSNSGPIEMAASGFSMIFFSPTLLIRFPLDLELGEMQVKVIFTQERPSH